MKNLKSKRQIILSHTLTYFNFLNLALAVLVILSGQYKNMLFMGVVISNSLIGIIQELKVKKTIDRLSIITASKAHLVTDQGIQDIPLKDLQAGASLYFSTGDQVVADCTVTKSQGLEINESMLTGESLPQAKKPGDKLFSGTFVVAGSGQATANQVGQDNYASRLVEKARSKRRASSEMQNTIKKIIRLVSYAILPIGLLLFYIQFYQSGSTLSDALVQTVAGVLGMIPEGLVLLTSVSFILGVGRLARQKALVQEMEAIEALARVNVLCLDKTGTITSGNLTLTDILPLNSYGDQMVENLMGSLLYGFSEDNATSRALKAYFPGNDLYQIGETMAFSSSRKFMGADLVDAGTFVLGAPDFLSQDLPLIRKAERYASQGYRVLLLAACDKLAPSAQDLEGLIPYALFLLSDQIKEDARETLEFFAREHVQVKILSGDNPATASIAASQAGIDGADRYVDASTLSEDPDLVQEELGDYVVFGRVSPEKKRAILKAYQARGQVVGMVGDGVNDVLALTEADCGIAMANGADAARQAAHILLMDSNFSSMKNIVKEGRIIIANIQRVSALYLTKTIYSVLLCILFIILGKDYPFIPIQLTLISAVAIGIPSFLLTLERAENLRPGSFSQHVLRISLPAAILLTAGILCIHFLTDPLGLSRLQVQTLNLLTGGAVSLGVLVAVCQPMKKHLALMCLVLSLGFLGALFFLPEFFGVLPLWDLF
ncbi:MAG: HAD-IC family P-type ATPase [Eubacterium sp.]|nr:HAD-IC family P-type ATPase [Eubacterium sp.]